MRKQIFSLSLVVVLAVFANGCASVTEMSSDRPDANLSVDGKADDWQGKLYIFKNDGLLAGVQDDSADIYVCVEGLDRGTSQAMMRGGVTVKFDPGTGDTNVVGVRFGGRGRGDGQDDEALFHPMTERSIQILDKKGNVALMIPAILSEREYGVQVALRDSGGAAVFEMKFPRRRHGSSFGLARVPDKKLSMEVEVMKGRAPRSAPANEATMEEPGGDEDRGEGMLGRGMGGERRREGGGERGERRTSRPEATTLSLRVLLNHE